MNSQKSSSCDDNREPLKEYNLNPDCDLEIISDLGKGV